MNELKGKYVSLKPWIRKKYDYNRPFKARNMYLVAIETEMAVLVYPVDAYDVDSHFWAPKSAIIEEVN